MPKCGMKAKDIGPWAYVRSITRNSMWDCQHD